MAIKLTAGELKMFQEALLSAFIRTELQLVVHVALDEPFDDIVTPAPFPAQVHNLVVYANSRGKVETLLNEARRENPGNGDLKRFEGYLRNRGQNTAESPTLHQPQIEQPDASAKKTMEALLFAGQDARVSYNFLRGAVATANSIARLTVSRFVNGQADGYTFFGTGWLIAPGVLITNYHVIEARDKRLPPDGPGEVDATPSDFEAQAQEVVAHFGFYAGSEREPDGTAVELSGAVLLAHNKELDYAILELKDAHRVADRPPLRIDQQAPKLKLGSRINIAQHPDGRAMRFAIRNNFYVPDGSTATHIRYQTDTEPGASGSPVCDDRWNVVGLHRASVTLDEAIVPAQETLDGLAQPVAVLNEALTLTAILNSLPADVRQRIADAQAKLQ